MATLYTFGEYVALTPSQFNSYSLIRYSSSQPGLAVFLGFSSSGSVNFSSKLGTVSALIDGWTGNDSITSGSGNDSLWGNSGNDTLSGGAGEDALFGDWDTPDRIGNDLLYGGDGNDILMGGQGNDGLYGGNGDDSFVLGEFASGNDSFFGGSGNDFLLVLDLFSTGVTQIQFNRLILNSAASIEAFALEDPSIGLVGTAGNDVIDLSGTVALTGGGGYSEHISFNLGSGNDKYTGCRSREVLSLDAGGDTVNLAAGDDSLILRGTDATGSSLNGGSGYDVLTLTAEGSGLTSVPMRFSNLTLNSAAGFEELIVEFGAELAGTAGNDVFDLSYISRMLNPVPIRLDAGHDRFSGSALDDQVEGGSGNDTLIGGLGNDWLMGGAGRDSMVGGLGDDTYQVDDLGDIFVELADQGTDRIVTSLASFTLGATFENLSAEGIGGLVGTGNSLNNQLKGAEGSDRLIGLSGDDWLDGGAANDTLIGGVGNDNYYAEWGDTIVELADEGLDTVTAFGGKLTLAAFVENLRHEGSSDFVGQGNDLGNRIDGGTGSDTLRGMGGADSLYGGVGNDVLDGGVDNDQLSGDDGNDSLVGASGEDGLSGGGGDDTLYGGVDNDQLGGGDGNDSLIGADGDDWLYGGAGDDELDGGIGNDRLYGGAGNDRFIYGLGTDVIIEAVDGGFDTVISQVAIMTLKANLEALMPGGRVTNVRFSGNGGDNLLTGSSGNDTLVGFGGNDTFHGGGGSDRFVGGFGDDIYYIASDGVKPVIIEYGDAGVDTVISAAARTGLPLYVENLELTSESGAVGIGNYLDNVLRGGIGNDRLEGRDGGDWLIGGAGADTMIGGMQSDRYSVDNLGDVVIEANNSGVDRVDVFVDGYVADDNVEQVFILIDTGLTVNGGLHTVELVGGAGNDTIVGGALGERIDGGLGRDSLMGGLGDDIYVVTVTGTTPDTWQLSDDVVELADQGVDFLLFSTAKALLDLPNVEGLRNTYHGATVSDAGSWNQGRAGNDIIIADISRDSLDGGLGSDTLTGGLGKDSFYFRDQLGAGNVDTITDFVPGVDKLMLNSDIFLYVSLFSGLNPSAFKSGYSVYADSDDRFIYTHFLDELGNYSLGMGLFYDPDGWGPIEEQLFAYFPNSPNLTAADFYWDGP